MKVQVNLTLESAARVKPEDKVTTGGTQKIRTVSLERFQEVIQAQSSPFTVNLRGAFTGDQVRRVIEIVESREVTIKLKETKAKAERVKETPDGPKVKKAKTSNGFACEDPAAVALLQPYLKV